MPQVADPENPNRREMMIYKPGRKPIDSVNSKRWGEKMAALTDMQRMFVLELCDQREKRNYSLAYRNAGFQDNSPNGVHVNSYRLACDPRILAAMQEVAEARVKQALPIAVNVIEKLAMAPGRDQYRAAKDIADRAGLMPTQKLEKHVTHEMLLTGEPELIEGITRMCAALGVDPEKLIGPRLGRQAVIEAEYEELPDGDVTGLEDLL